MAPVETVRRVIADHPRPAGLGVVLVLAAIPFSTTAYLTEVFFLGLVFVMLGVSWNLIAGYAGQISLGHAAFFGLGAFVSAWVTTPARADLPGAIQQPTLVSLAVGALAAGLIALAVGPLVFRLSGHYFAIGTLALATIVQLVFLDQRQFTGGSTGFYVRPTVGSDAVFLIALVVTAGTVLLTRRIVTSKAGLAMRAIHDDELAASSLGVSPLYYKLYAFVVSAAMAGLAGALYAQFTLYVNPESTLSVIWLVDTLVVVVLGGIGTMYGPIFGALLFVALDSVLQQFFGEFATAVEGLLIVLVIVFLPRGLYGYVRDRDSWSGLVSLVPGTDS